MSETDADEDGGLLPAGYGKAVKLTVGFAIAILIVYLIGVVVGWEETVERLSTAHLGWVALACASSLLCLAVWSKMWQVVLDAVGVSVTYRKVVVTFFAASFANYVTPMGQAGGEPLIAYVLSRDTEADYEESLASVLITDVLRLLPFFTVAGLGIGYLLVEGQLPEIVETVAVVLAALAVGLPTLMVVGWRYRLSVRQGVLRVLSPVARHTERVSIDSLRERIDRLYSSVELISSSRRTILVSVTLAYVGWILFALPLYFSGIALDLPVSLLLVFFVVPATIVVGFTPLPGGLGAIEGALVVLLTALAAMSAGEALAITTVYRLTSYWIVVAVGGVAALWVTARV
ncbi:MAG: lysylphosphatidylglycerol synthase transmembrane domain-containing protein [Halobacteriales archaeon]|nr:lysylphosphatidylglycerol synthase transmembrane domain-containing protein [Halobacteriales archaeon]